MRNTYSAIQRALGLDPESERLAGVPDGESAPHHISPAITNKQLGGRGRDGEGNPVAIPAGQSGAMVVQDNLAKADEFPKRPPKAINRITLTPTANSGELLDEEQGMPIRGLLIDNYTSCWVYVSGIDRFFPPMTVGIAAPVWVASTKLRVLMSAPGGTSQPALTAGGVVLLTAVEEMVEREAGVAVGAVTASITGTVTTTPSTSTTPTNTNVNDAATNQTLLASNTSRKGATIYNDSTAVLYVKLGTTATATSFTIALQACTAVGDGSGGYYEVPFAYTGRIDGIWASDQSGAARITELT